MSDFAPGALVTTRGREWIVLPDSTEQLLLLRPLGGSDEEIAGVLTELEEVKQATFDLPSPDELGDARSLRMLRDALRLGFRSSAGPFRSFASLNVEPRPYQLVPLLMALRLDPVRLLIADDVGIGKTIEAGLVARELLDTGQASGLAVICPPHLAEQWQSELATKFNLECELVLASTAPRLERGLRIGESIFQRHSLVIVSLDFIKSDRRRDQFLRDAPDLVIVDEAHTCADQQGRGGRMQRYQLLRGLADDPSRHLVLVTATPHSGNHQAFRALIGLLGDRFQDLPDETSEADRRALARHMVQRRRAHIRQYLDAETSFPDRLSQEQSYTLDPTARGLLDDLIAYARTSVTNAKKVGRREERISWWSALALLRAFASSPAALAATLRSRAVAASASDAASADELGAKLVLDEAGDEADAPDATPGADTTTDGDPALLAFAERADELRGIHDTKLAGLFRILTDLRAKGHNPIVFCRFIATAEYVAEALRGHLRGITVEAVTGLQPAEERERRVRKLGAEPKRILVATDCLSEGVNLQEGFDAVVHYDLSWNPTRHEQREGRVDRFGQTAKEVRVVTYYGADTQIDGLVLRVLLRKHASIRKELGVSVPVPGDAGQVLEAILEGVILATRTDEQAMNQLTLSEELIANGLEPLEAEWSSLVERERRSRTVYAQETLSPDEVARELDAVRAAIGGDADTSRFVQDATRAAGGTAAEHDDELRLDLTETPIALRDRLGLGDEERVLLGPFSRSGQVVAGLAGFVLDGALDPKASNPIVRRAGAMRTPAVTTRTTLLLLRFRSQLTIGTRGGERQTLVEEAGIVAYRGAPAHADWLTPEDAEALLSAQPAGNVLPEQARAAVSQVIDGYDELRSNLDAEARAHADAAQAAHLRVRQELGRTGVVTIKPQLPPDVLAITVLLPA